MSGELTGPGMYFSDRCGCGEFGEKAAPWTCESCWQTEVEDVRVVLGEEAAARFRETGPALLLEAARVKSAEREAIRAAKREEELRGGDLHL